MCRNEHGRKGCHVPLQVSELKNEDRATRHSYGSGGGRREPGWSEKGLSQQRPE